MSSERDQINNAAGIHHTLSRKILGIDWYATESQARRVIEWLAEGQEPVVWRFKERADDLRSAWLYVKKRGHVPGGHKFEALYAAPVSEAKAQGVVMQSTDGGRNPRYEGLFDGETEEQRASRLNAAPVQQVSVPDVSAMARVLADRNADACNVNREDNWAIYGRDYIDDVTAMLAAAPAAPAADAGVTTHD